MSGAAVPFTINCPINETSGLLAPAGPPPPGVCPNYTDPDDLRAAQIAVTVLCLSIVTFLIAARLFTFFKKNLGKTKLLIWEEVASVIVWMLLFTYCVMCTIMTETVLGRHIWDVPAAAVMGFTRLTNIAELLYPPMIWGSKLIILSQFIRIFAPNRKGFTFWGAHFLIWVNLAFYISVFFVVLFECTPRRRIWDKEVEGTCLDAQKVFITTGSFNLASDVAILLLPLKAIWTLNMRTKQKIQISAIFSTGLFACISSAVRLSYSIQYLSTTDATYVVEQVGLWSQAEVTSVIICGALPVLPQFWKLIRKKKPSSSYHQYGSHSKKMGGSAWSKDEDQQKLNNSYIPLEGRNNKTSASHDGVESVRNIEPAYMQPVHTPDPFPLDSGIVKTTRIETSTSHAV